MTGSGARFGAGFRPATWRSPRAGVGDARFPSCSRSAHGVRRRPGLHGGALPSRGAAGGTPLHRPPRRRPRPPTDAPPVLAENGLTGNLRARAHPACDRRSAAAARQAPLLQQGAERRQRRRVRLLPPPRPGRRRRALRFHRHGRAEREPRGSRAAGSPRAASSSGATPTRSSTSACTMPRTSGIPASRASASSPAATGPAAASARPTPRSTSRIRRRAPRCPRHRRDSRWWAQPRCSARASRASRATTRSGSTSPRGSGDYGTGRGQLAPGQWLQKFRTAFASPAGTAEQLITFDNIALAIAEYQRSATFVDSPFARYVRGDNAAIGEQAKRGALFFFRPLDSGGANCVQCHAGDFLSNEQHHAIGFPQVGPGMGDGTGATDDFGRGRQSGDPLERYRFRTPSLLNVELTGPYGHAGAYATLEKGDRALLHARCGGERLPRESPVVLAADVRRDAELRGIRPRTSRATPRLRSRR